MMLLTKKIKLEVSEQDAATLEFMQGKCRGLYNWWVMRLRSGEKWPGWRKAKKTLQESRAYDPERQWVYGKLLQEVYFRLDGAMAAFFRRVQNGETPGFPRVRPRHCFFTLCYPAMYIQVAGGLNLAALKKFSVAGSVNLPTMCGMKNSPQIRRRMFTPSVRSKLCQ